jgi:ribonuclease HI
MTRERKESVRERKGLRRQISRKGNRRAARHPWGHLLTKDAAREQLYLAQQWKIRSDEKRLRRPILRHDLLGSYRWFKGSVTIPHPIHARESDVIRLRDIEDLCSAGKAAVYWVDGAYRKNGYSAAGIVWRIGDSTSQGGYQLGRLVGDSENAEVFAIAAALGQAKKAVTEGAVLDVVRIYSDCQAVLEGLKKNTLCTPGPLLPSGTPALKAIYDHTDWLTDGHVDVELYWVKGHAHSEGNILADKAAEQAILDQLHADLNTGSHRKAMTDADIPEIWKERGQHWADEWLFRANKDLDQVSLSKSQLMRLSEVAYASSEDSESDYSDSIGHTHGYVSCPDLDDLDIDDREIRKLQMSIHDRGTTIRELKQQYATSIGHDSQLFTMLQYREQTQFEEEMSLWRMSQERWAQRRLLSIETPRDQDLLVEEIWPVMHGLQVSDVKLSIERLQIRIIQLTSYMARRADHDGSLDAELSWFWANLCKARRQLASLGGRHKKWLQPPRRKDWAFVLDEHHLYGNISIEEAIADLRKKHNLIEFQIKRLETLISNSTWEETKDGPLSNLKLLYDHRYLIEREIKAKKAERLAQRQARQRAQDSEAEDEVEQVNDGSDLAEPEEDNLIYQEQGLCQPAEPPLEHWVGDPLLAILEALFGEDISMPTQHDTELERSSHDSVAESASPSNKNPYLLQQHPIDRAQKVSMRHRQQERQLRKLEVTFDRLKADKKAEKPRTAQQERSDEAAKIQTLTNWITSLKDSIQEREHLIRSKITSQRFNHKFEPQQDQNVPYLEVVQASDQKRLAELTAERDVLQSAQNNPTGPRTTSSPDTYAQLTFTTHDVRPVATLEKLRTRANRIADIKALRAPLGNVPLESLEKNLEKELDKIRFMAQCNEGYRQCVLAGRDIFDIGGL